MEVPGPIVMSDIETFCRGATFGIESLVGFRGFLVNAPSLWHAVHV